MLNNNKVIIETKSGEKYEFLTNSGIILSEKGLKASSQQRIENLKQIENACMNDINVRALQRKNLTARKAKDCVMKNGLTELIIEVTNSCNMRCTYCVFGEKYGELREHGQKNMTFETAKVAIDTFLTLVDENRIHNPDGKPIFSFYGGEPLLNFTLIKKCVEYIKKVYSGEVFITLTSNATLITDEMLYFFKENLIHPIFSLDGGREEHNLHRVIRNNVGSYDKVIEKLYRAYEVLQFPLFINAVYSYDTDLRKVIDFFVEHEEFFLLSINMVSPVNTSYFDEFTEEIKNNFFRTWNELQNEYYAIVKCGRNEKASKEMSKEDRRILVMDMLFSRQCMNLVLRQILNNNKQLGFTAACVPGERIFVDVNGDYHICEKISRTRKIGCNDTGLDYEEIANIMNEYYENISSTCISCAIKKVCPSCFNIFLTGGVFEKKDEMCAMNKNAFVDNLAHYCYINELDNQWLDNYRSQYYKKAKELVVTLG
ncbi:MAG: radical SAM protein [Anaerocolumna sp.]